MVNKCRYCGDEWSPNHKWSNQKLYNCEVERESETSNSDSNKEGSKEEINDINTHFEEAMPKTSLPIITSIA